jgi:glyoxylase-like metal-dependent hydrolase (beta-lactamase superfamily II)
MQVTEIATGLWRWVAFHEEWRRDVGSVYLETADAVCLVDPLVPTDSPDELFGPLDRDIERAGAPVHVLLTVFWHVRSAPEIVERYGATLWAPSRSALPVERRTGLAGNQVRPGDALPGGIVAHASGRASELVYHVPSQAALVVGDVLLGSPLRICPSGWVGKGGQDAVREALEPLLAQHLQSVIVSHGDPVLGGGTDALRAALSPS